MIITYERKQQKYEVEKFNAYAHILFQIFYHKDGKKSYNKDVSQKGLLNV